MNEFYLTNSYIPLLDAAQLISGSQGIVYFRLYGTEPQKSLNLLPSTSEQESLNLLPAPAGEQEALNLLPAPAGGNNGEGSLVPIIGSAAGGATSPPPPAPSGGGSGY